MKKVSKKYGAESVDIDDILPEYDFSRARPNKYASQYLAGSSVVVLEPDVAAVFPSSGEVNDALRALAEIIRQSRSRRRASGRKRLKPAARSGRQSRSSRRRRIAPRR